MEWATLIVSGWVRLLLNLDDESIGSEIKRASPMRTLQSLLLAGGLGGILSLAGLTTYLMIGAALDFSEGAYRADLSAFIDLIMQDSSGFPGGLILGSLISVPIGSLIQYSIGMLILSALLFVLARASGGQAGFWDQTHLISMLVAPFYCIGSFFLLIPSANLVAWSLIILVLLLKTHTAIRKIHHLGGVDATKVLALTIGTILFMFGIVMLIPVLWWLGVI